MFFWHFLKKGIFLKTFHPHHLSLFIFYAFPERRLVKAISNKLDYRFEPYWCAFFSEYHLFGRFLRQKVNFQGTKFWSKHQKHIFFTVTNFSFCSILKPQLKTTYVFNIISWAFVLIWDVQKLGIMIWSFFGVFLTFNRFLGCFLGRC